MLRGEAPGLEARGHEKARSVRETGSPEDRRAEAAPAPQDRHVEWRADAERARRPLLAAAAPPDRRARRALPSQRRPARAQAARAAADAAARPRRRAQRRQTHEPAVYTHVGEDYVLVASKGGYPRHPAWFHNLRAHPDTTIQVGRHVLQVHAHVASDEERERLWPRCVATYSGFADYQAARAARSRSSSSRPARSDDRPSRRPIRPHDYANFCAPLDRLCGVGRCAIACRPGT